MNKLDVVREVRKLLDNPENWTKNANARDRYGVYCNPYSDNAHCWCLIGATHKATSCETRGETRTSVLRDIAQYAGGSITGFNDDPAISHKDIINLLDRMIRDYSNEY